MKKQCPKCKRKFYEQQLCPKCEEEEDKSWIIGLAILLFIMGLATYLIY